MTTLEDVRLRAKSTAKTYGYYLNPDQDFLKDILEGLKQNEERYGFPSCPCRLASGKFEFDRDIICPCDYSGLDIQEYGNCYCALYVRNDIFEGRTSFIEIPERRPEERIMRAYLDTSQTSSRDSIVSYTSSEVTKAMWYCKQCGYVCFREDPPYVCPICKAKKEMFAKINVKVNLQG